MTQAVLVARIPRKSIFANLPAYKFGMGAGLKGVFGLEYQISSIGTMRYEPSSTPTTMGLIPIGETITQPMAPDSPLKPNHAVNYFPLVLLLSLSLNVYSWGQAAPSPNRNETAAIEQMRVEILAVKRGALVDSAELCNRVFQSGKAELILLCLKEPRLTGEMRILMFNQPNSSLKRETTLLLLRANSDIWGDDTPRNDNPGSGANVASKIALIELCEHMLRSALSGELIRKYPLGDRQNRLELARAYEKVRSADSSRRNIPSEENKGQESTFDSDNGRKGVQAPAPRKTFATSDWPLLWIFLLPAVGAALWLWLRRARKRKSGNRGVSSTLD